MMASVFLVNFESMVVSMSTNPFFLNQNMSMIFLKQVLMGYVPRHYKKIKFGSELFQGFGAVGADDLTAKPGIDQVRHPADVDDFHGWWGWVKPAPEFSFE